ncbi:S-adenosyl-L-methionine-dependent methyltransferase [Russula earlei]|uniref:S-adenosyl-L-methionine-dependent methyltransferase n=1 Tax=Russula earlei TaxID=71964 RepID=A0ACC0TU77_9AGAM|nr:S-adenosyl-L-methionine-dependent methyltransferase [Russula earlei]
MPVPWCIQGSYLAKRPSFTLDPAFHAGAYYVQEASSMFLYTVLQQTIAEPKGKKVLDLCAAPGGKSTLLASYFTDGLVVSNEVIKSRAAVLVENITKWGSDNVIVTNNDPSSFQSLENYFDAIVIDAPCSGSGLFRRDSEAVKEWSIDNVNLCSHRQQRIIADVYASLKEDGILIYSTCSYSKEEDEQLLDWIVDEFDMQSLPLQTKDEWHIVEVQSDKQKASGYRFYPYLLKGEGFFIAAFKKKHAGNTIRYKEHSLTKLSKQEEQAVHNYLPLSAAYQFFKQGESIKVMPEQWIKDLQVLAKYLYIKKAGIELGAIKGKDIIPHHELALSLLPLHHFPTISLNEMQALQYLRKMKL